jgi:hypothetical protein
MVDRYRYSGILAIVLQYAALVYFISINKLPLSWSHTVSDFGSTPETRTVFVWAFTISGLLYALFGIWLSRRIHLHRNFLVTLAIGVTAQVSLSWIPDKGSTNLLHFVFAIIVMICMPLTVYYFSHVIRNRTVKKLARGIIWAEVIALLLLPFVATFRITVLSEIIAAISFQFWTVVATLKTR